MPRVIVVQDSPGKNFLPAEEYGELEIVVPHNWPSTSIKPILRSLIRALSDYTDKDFLLPVGDPIVIGIATTLAARYNRGRVRFLKWDKQERRYYVVEVDTNDWKGDSKWAS